MMWVKETFPLRLRDRYPLIDLRLTSSSFVGISRNEVAVGTSRLASMFDTMRAAAPRRGVPSGAAVVDREASDGAGALGATAGGAKGGAGAGALVVPGEELEKNSRQLSLTDDGSVRNCSNISSTSHALGPAMGEAESSATSDDSIGGAAAPCQ